MGSNNRMNPHAGIEENAQIDSDCIMGMYSTVGSSAKLERNVYVGDNCRIGSNSVIGQNSIIQPYAMIPDDGLVGANEIIIKTPTTAELYKNSLPVDRISQSEYIMIATVFNAVVLIAKILFFLVLNWQITVNQKSESPFKICSFLIMISYLHREFAD